MKIVDYLRASLFNSGNAAYRLAVNDESYLGVSINLITSKLNNVQYQLGDPLLEKHQYDAFLMKKIKYTSLLKSLVSMNTFRSDDALSLSSGSGRVPGDETDDDYWSLNVQRTARVCTNGETCQQTGEISGQRRR